ncbi:hypothetical protein NDU88_001287 [Pleurodeles waltl]|uniref:Uncharacterized protein n=1 Tax=Pleurodeles waltl TaxID=8319 RepID=A0AAV7P6Q8_PLEWA|nr:hypothetical protein NDU88_001287 [Pleurodeles waltl]
MSARKDLSKMAATPTLPYCKGLRQARAPRWGGAEHQGQRDTGDRGAPGRQVPKDRASGAVEDPWQKEPEHRCCRPPLTPPAPFITIPGERKKWSLDL